MLMALTWLSAVKVSNHPSVIAAFDLGYGCGFISLSSEGKISNVLSAI